MQGDFFQVLRRVQKEERNKSSLARGENDFYKQLRDYIKDLERSVANDPFGNEQLLLNNAQRIATEICELRESKITQAANNNIYRSFLLFRKDNPQFDLLDTTPLNLTDEEETFYFSLMDSLKNHRYRISLDEYVEETDIEDEEEDFDEDEETTFVEDSYEESVRESETNVSDELEESIDNAKNILAEQEVDNGAVEIQN
jgi:DNA replication factor GINS